MTAARELAHHEHPHRVVDAVQRLPEGSQVKLADELLATAETNTADAPHRCHRALELDGLNHAYAADEWLPVIYDTAAPLLESSRLPPPAVSDATASAAGVKLLERVGRVARPQHVPTRVVDADDRDMARTCGRDSRRPRCIRRR